MKILIMICIFIMSNASQAFASDSYKDVPADHWAAQAVKEVSQAGIMKGYPDGKFYGEKAVTRYELAVALANLIQHLQNSQKPLVSNQKQNDQHWAAASANILASEGYVKDSSNYFSDGNKKVSPEELADILAQIAAKVIENNVPSIQDDKEGSKTPFQTEQEHQEHDH